MTFYLTLGPFIVYLLTPLFVAAGILLAVLMAGSRLWRGRSRDEAEFSEYRRRWPS